MITTAKRAWRERRRLVPLRGFVFGRPVVALQSDDWGRIGVRDREGFEALRAAGLDLGSDPYDFYTLEGADDVRALCEVLRRHRDADGRHPVIVASFVTANVDFEGTLAAKPGEVRLRPLARGLPGRWTRPGLFEAYSEAIGEGLLYPAFHGLTHFCRAAAEGVLRGGGERGAILRRVFGEDTPYIYNRMPWIGYEYWKPAGSFLDFAEQRAAVAEGLAGYRELFGTDAVSACAPGYRASDDTYRVWSAAGIRVAQEGIGGADAPFLDRWGLLHLPRTVAFEAGIDPERYTVDAAVRDAAAAISRGVPAVVCVHAINFHSTLRDFRRTTVDRLDAFLTAMEKRYPDLAYVHDGDLRDLVDAGTYLVGNRRVGVPVRRRWMPPPDVARLLRRRRGTRSVTEG